jgi:hypothetical protein
MPPRESTSRPPRTNVYSVLLVVSAVFLALAVFITWGELKSDYDFMGTAGEFAGEQRIDDTAPVGNIPADAPADMPAAE